MNLFTFIFSLVISIACFWASFSFVKLYFSVSSWDKVSAKIISKKVELHEKYSTSRSPFGIKAEYQYTYNGQTYTNNKVYLVELMNGQSNFMESTAKQALERIKAEMPIYVNPKNPQQSVIFCEGLGLYIFIFVMGIISLLVGIGYLIKLKNTGI